MSLDNLEVAQHQAEAGLALLGDTLRAQGQPQQAVAALDEAERLAQPLAPGSRLHAEISAFKQVLGREST